ncbi:hypothetical protein AJ79_01614 [Helicocarpus griseus UAMH5409]|uniref:Uncharacterized protein n=1 Tax=Helicocarpus griseus UAMH5409 TaxID=1447875 RepID=A0A2B7Y6S6_9EURO|nr:hypothetical protein AJ79_01614 [Helicocarpus griseus UAMH5409]
MARLCKVFPNSESYNLKRHSQGFKSSKQQGLFESSSTNHQGAASNPSNPSRAKVVGLSAEFEKIRSGAMAAYEASKPTQSRDIGLVDSSAEMNFSGIFL